MYDKKVLSLQTQSMIKSMRQDMMGMMKWEMGQTSMK